MPISLTSIVGEFASSPSALGLAVVVGATKVLLAIVKSDSPVTRAIAGQMRRRRPR